MLFYAAALQTLNYDWDTLRSSSAIHKARLIFDDEPRPLLRLGHRQFSVLELAAGISEQLFTPH